MTYIDATLLEIRERHCSDDNQQYADQECVMMNQAGQPQDRYQARQFDVTTQWWHQGGQLILQVPGPASNRQGSKAAEEKWMSLEWWM